MPKDGTSTRTRILEAALELVIQQGFGSTSIDNVIEKVGITKGAFFYHFKTKQDLAMALVEYFAQRDDVHLEDARARSEKLSRDPRQQLLIFVGLFEEAFENLVEPYPGCLFASFIMQGQLFDDSVKGVISEQILKWREYLGGKIRETMQQHKPKLAVDVEALADMFTTVMEGAFIMSKSLNEPGLVAQQLRHYRNYLELLFAD